MKTKMIPVMLALVAGLITCIVSFRSGLSTGEFVKALCLVVLVFLVIGFIWKIILDRFFQPPKPQSEEGSEETGEGTDKEVEDGISSQEPLEVSEAEEDEEW